MSIKISQLVTDSVSLVLKFGEEVLNVSYTPSKMTPATLAELGAIDGLPVQQQIEAIVRLGANLLTKWDLADEEGNAVPVTEKGLRNVPMGVLNRVIYEVIQDMQMGEAKGETSAAA